MKVTVFFNGQMDIDINAESIADAMIENNFDSIKDTTMEKINSVLEKDCNWEISSIYRGDNAICTW